MENDERLGGRQPEERERGKFMRTFIWYKLEREAGHI
jgi:hypothetical protein